MTSDYLHSSIHTGYVPHVDAAFTIELVEGLDPMLYFSTIQGLIFPQAGMATVFPWLTHLVRYPVDKTIQLAGELLHTSGAGGYSLPIPAYKLDLGLPKGTKLSRAKVRNSPCCGGISWSGMTYGTMLKL